MNVKLGNCLNGEKNGVCQNLENILKTMVLKNAENILHVTFMTNGKKVIEEIGVNGND